MTMSPEAGSMSRKRARVSELLPAPVRPTIPTYGVSNSVLKQAVKFLKPNSITNYPNRTEKNEYLKNKTIIFDTFERRYE